MVRPEDIFLVKVENKDVERIRSFLEEGIDPSYDNNKAIAYAARGDIGIETTVADTKSPVIIKLLLADSRVNPSARDNAALYFAATTNDVESVKLLINDKRFKITRRVKNLSKTLPKDTETYRLIQNIVEAGKTPWEQKQELGAAEINKQKRYEIQEGLEKRGVSSGPGTGPLNKILDFANIPRPAKGTGRRRRKTRKNGKTRRR